MSIHKDKVALVCLDFAVRWIDAYPAKSRTTEEVLASLADFKGPDVHVKAVYSDNAPEIIAAVRGQAALHPRHGCRKRRSLSSARLSQVHLESQELSQSEKSRNPVCDAPSQLLVVLRAGARINVVGVTRGARVGR